MNTVTVLLDGQAHAVPEGCSLAALVASLQHAPAAVTTAVNGCFVPRDQRERHLLREGDAVLLFQPIVGG
jgi:sulfur carrier protein